MSKGGLTNCYRSYLSELSCRHTVAIFWPGSPNVKKKEENREATQIFKIYNFIPASKR